MNYQILQGDDDEDGDDVDDDHDFETESYSTYWLRIFFSQNDLEILIIRFLLPKCRNYSCVQPLRVYLMLSIEPWDPCLLGTQKLIWSFLQTIGTLSLRFLLWKILVKSEGHRGQFNVFLHPLTKTSLLTHCQRVIQLIFIQTI